jgi:hypothetical protein
MRDDSRVRRSLLIVSLVVTLLVLVQVVAVTHGG